MAERADNPRLAAVEFLDGAPAAPAGRAWRWELGLGLLLLLVVAGPGLWTWAQDQTALGRYHAGQQAAARQDWTAARAAYLAAGAYADAPARAGAAARLIVARDQAYSALQAAATRQDWPAVLQAVAPLRRIAPDYRDTRRLGDTAAAVVGSAALSGTVALRSAVTPPGLYYYGAGGWHFLAGSDARSRVLGVCQDGAILYDGPSPGTPPVLLPPPTPFGGPDPALPPFGGRRFLAGPPDGGPAREAVIPDPGAANQYLCAGGGLWSVRYAAPDDRQVSQIALQPGALAPQSGAAPGAGRLQLPGPDWGIVNVGPHGDWLLLAQSAGSTPTTRETALYTAGPAGDNRRRLDRQPGRVVATDVSPSGRWILATRYIPDQPDHGRESLFLLDRTGAVAPRLLAWLWKMPQQPLIPGQPGDPFAAFLHSGRFGDTLVLRSWQDGRYVLRLLDPSRPDHPLAEAALDSHLYWLPFVREDATGGALLLGWNFTPGGRDLSGTVAVLDPPAHVRLFHPALAGATALMDARTAANRLLYGTLAFDLSRQEYDFNFRSLPLGAPGGTIPAPSVYSGSIGAFGSMSQVLFPPWHLGTGLFAYTTPGDELRVRSYDGGEDILFESGVAALCEVDLYEGRYTLPW